MKRPYKTGVMYNYKVTATLLADHAEGTNSKQVAFQVWGNDFDDAMRSFYYIDPITEAWKQWPDTNFQAVKFADIEIKAMAEVMCLWNRMDRNVREKMFPLVNNNFGSNESLLILKLMGCAFHDDLSVRTTEELQRKYQRAFNIGVLDDLGWKYKIFPANHITL
jgi:hypothetical protein